MSPLDAASAVLLADFQLASETALALLVNLWSCIPQELPFDTFNVFITAIIKPFLLRDN